MKRIMPESSSHVLEELREQLHQATERFHAARQELEHWMDASEYRHQERVNTATEHVRDAEREVERIEQQIKSAISGAGDA